MSKKHNKEHQPTAEAAPIEEQQTPGAQQCQACAAHAGPDEQAIDKPQEPSKEEQYLKQLISLQADFENYRKRTEREKPLFISFGKEEVIKKLLPLYDTLLKAETEVNKKEVNAQHIVQGLKMIFEQFSKVFKSEGVEVLSAKGKPYDPMTQEVVTTTPCEDKDDGIVVEEIAGGVKIDGRVVRPAQVIVGKKQDIEATK